MNKISLVVGHTFDRKGAYGVQPLGMYEYDFNTALSQTIVTSLQTQFEFNIFLRDLKSISQTYQDVADWKPDVNFELHFNSSEQDGAFGTETLSTERSRIFAKIVQNEMCTCLGRDKNGGDRGVRVLTKIEERGFMSVSQLNIPNVIIEPFFGSNPIECRIMMGKLEEFPHALANAVEHYLSLS